MAERDKCDAHGPYVIIRDKPAARKCPQRAKITLPDMLKIRDSPIHGKGVFARDKLKARMRFGPYQGKRIEESEVEDPSYVFRVRYDVQSDLDNSHSFN